MGNVADYMIALGTILAVFGTVLKMTGDLKKSCDESIKGVYKRFDVFKTQIEATHVSKEVCSILHSQIVEDIIEIKSDVKKLLAQNGLK